jgi:hypothetical protein
MILLTITKRFDMRINTLLLFLFFELNLFVGLIGCNTTEPNNNLQINVEDISCTEAWINVTGQTGREVVLNRDDKGVQRFTLSTSPQTIYDDSLLPNKSYTYQVSSIQNREASSKITVTTLDTSSTNYSWQTLTFGGAASSIFEDVAIVNENDVWAVGTIFVYDSTGQVDPNIYNAVHWDGSKWNLIRLQFFTFCGQNHTGIYPAKSVFLLNDGEIVISSGSELTYIKDQKQINTECVPVSVNKIWGTNSNDFFIAGNSGNIAHYQNGSWQKIESGTNTDIQDIWGNNSSSGENLILYTGYQEIHRLTNNTETEEIPIPLNRIIRSVWFQTKYKIYAAGDGIFTSIDMKNWKEEDIPDEYATFKIRGTNVNYIWSTGGYGFTGFFNGIRWYTIAEAGLSRGNYYSLDVKDNIVVLVGSNGSSALITIGKRK